MIPRLIWIWRIQWWCSFFHFWFGSILVLENCFEKSKLFVEAEIWNSMVELGWWFSFFSFLDRKYPSWVNLVQKFKISSLSWNLIPRLFRIYKFAGDVRLFSFRPFLASFVEKIHLEFWCCLIISRQFTRSLLN